MRPTQCSIHAVAKSGSENSVLGIGCYYFTDHTTTNEYGCELPTSSLTFLPSFPRLDLLISEFESSDQYCVHTNLFFHPGVNHRIPAFHTFRPTFDTLVATLRNDQFDFFPFDL